MPVPLPDMPPTTAASTDLLALLMLAAMLLALTVAAATILVTTASLRLARRSAAGPGRPRPFEPAVDPWRESARRLQVPASASRH